MQQYVRLLATGQPVEFRPRGSSMQPLIRSGQLVRLEPIDFKVDDIVLAHVHGQLFLHLVAAIEGNRVQVRNSHGRVNGWTTRDRVYGVCTAIDHKPLSSH